MNLFWDDIIEKVLDAGEKILWFIIGYTFGMGTLYGVIKFFGVQL